MDVNAEFGGGELPLLTSRGLENVDPPSEEIAAHTLYDEIFAAPIQVRHISPSVPSGP
jgi:hypothetical protein